MYTYLDSLIFAKFNLCFIDPDYVLENALLRGPVWETEVRQRTYTWLARTKTWICSATSLHIVYFENLVQNMKEEINSIIEFLAFPPNQDNINCAIYHGVSTENLDIFNIIFVRHK